MAVKRNTRWEHAFKIVFLCFYSIPTFYLAYIAIAVFSLKLGWLPAANMFSFHIDSSDAMAQMGDRLRHLILPVAVLTLGSAAALARFARGSLLDVMRQEFIRTARAKGLPGKTILWRHAFKNALAPVLTVIGLSFPFLLGGSVVVEKVFAWPGMGALTVDAIFARDYPVILAASFIAACMVILGNLLADISYSLVDPRIKLLSTR
jgi:peptide/nickel transport system permease protein